MTITFWILATDREELHALIYVTGIDAKPDNRRLRVAQRSQLFDRNEGEDVAVFLGMYQSNL